MPCATGEEPLTIAMALNEAGWFDRTRITIHASDASSAAIAKARIGRYRERSFRSLPPALREKYFVGDDGACGARCRTSASGSPPGASSTSLPADEIAPYATQPGHFLPQRVHLLFARPASRPWLTRWRTGCRCPSYLFVGASESLLNVTNRFMLEDLEQAFVYVKR